MHLWEKERTILSGNIYSIRIIDGKLWCCMGPEETVDIRNLDLSLDRSVEFKFTGSVNDVARRDNYQVFIACASGLLVSDKEGLHLVCVNAFLTSQVHAVNVKHTFICFRWYSTSCYSAP